LLGLDGIITEMRGSWLELAGIPVRVTYHPSCLLQTNTNLSIRRQLWEDMLEVMDKLAMPVSEKQRAFFLPKP
jgi:DNA polymerase